MFVAMKLFALLAAVSDPMPGPSQALNALHASTEGGAEGARLGQSVGRIAPGFKVDLTLIDTADPTWSPMNSARVSCSIERPRRAPRVRRLSVLRTKATTLSITIKNLRFNHAGCSCGFAVISGRVAKLQPYLDRAHSQIMTAPLYMERLPFGSNEQ